MEQPYKADPITRLYFDGKHHDLNLANVAGALKAHIKEESEPDAYELCQTLEWAGKILEQVNEKLEQHNKIIHNLCHDSVVTESAAQEIAKKHFDYDKVCEDFNEGGFPGDGYWQEPDTDYLLELFGKKLDELTGK